MNTSPKTLQIYLPHGTPNGLRIAELTTRTVQAVSCPRTRLGDLYSRPEARQIATYFLFGGADGDSKPEAYVGQTEDLPKRLRKHNAEVEFWHTVVFLVSRTGSFTQAHIRWMEWKAIAAATAANRYRLSNKNNASEPFVTESIRADLDELFETGSILVESLGHPLFRPLVDRAGGGGGEQEEWFLTGRGASARGSYSSEGFVVREGSYCRLDVVASAKQSFVSGARQRLIEEGVLAAEDGRLVFKEDRLFNTPSGAAIVVLGSNANGWMKWKNKAGVPIDQLRKNATADHPLLQSEI